MNRTSEIYFNRDNTPFVLAGAHGYNSGFDTASRNSTPGDGYAGARLQPNGDLGQVSYDGEASSPLERRSLFGRATHELNDNLTAFAQANYTSVEVETGQNGYPPAITVWSAPVPLDGRPIPAALQTLLATRVRNVDDPKAPAAAATNVGPTDPWQLFRVLDFLGGPATTDSKSNVYQIMAGVEGSFSQRDWTWEAYVSSGKTDVSNFFENIPSLQRYWNLIGAAPNALTLQGAPGNGTWGRGTFTQGRNYAQTCTSGLPIFSNSSNLGAAQVSADCLESIASNARALTSLEQNIAEFNLQGKIADMKSGELRFAVGATLAQERVRVRARRDERSRVGRRATDEHLRVERHGRRDQVRELYGELLVPVTSKFDLEFGVRMSDYIDSAVGTTDTSKAMFTFRATDSLSLRGGFQKAERAANTAELFQGVSLLVVPFAPSDPCSFTTTRAVGQRRGQPEPRRRCRRCAARSSTTATRSRPTTACRSFDTGPARPERLRAAGQPVLPARDRAAQGQRERAARRRARRSRWAWCCKARVASRT